MHVGQGVLIPMAVTTLLETQWLVTTLLESSGSYIYFTVVLINWINHGFALYLSINRFIQFFLCSFANSSAEHPSTQPT